jgi:hypothetical protein
MELKDDLSFEEGSVWPIKTCHVSWRKLPELTGSEKSQWVASVSIETLQKMWEEDPCNLLGRCVRNRAAGDMGA